MRINKRCACGIFHEFLPSNAKYLSDQGSALQGWYFECACRPTLFQPDDVQEAA